MSYLPILSCNTSPWSEREISRFVFRCRLFERRGWTAERAEHWAERLVERDRDRDTRRLCMECRHLQRPSSPGAPLGCAAEQRGELPGTAAWARRTLPRDTPRPEPPGAEWRRFHVLEDQLQRCERFDWQTT